MILAKVLLSMGHAGKADEETPCDDDFTLSQDGPTTTPLCISISVLDMPRDVNTATHFAREALIYSAVP